MSESRRDHCEKDAFSGAEVYERFKNAVVTIETRTSAIDGSVPTVITTTGTGFFIDDKAHIVTAASVVLLNSLVRDPPAPTPPAPDFYRVADIYVTVFNAGNNKKAYIYKADVVGIDGAGNTALLKITCTNPWNVDLPDLKCQPYFKFASSRDYSPGSPVYTVYNAQFNNESRAFAAGVISNNRQFSTQALAINSTSDAMTSAELVTTTITVLNPSFYGAPVITKYGNVIGIFAYTYGSDVEPLNGTISAAISEHFFKPVLSAFLEGECVAAKAFKKRVVCNGSCDSASTCEADPFRNLVYIDDILGPYFRYQKGYMGLSWQGYDITIYGEIPNIAFKRQQGIIITATDDTVPIGAFFDALLDDGETVLLTAINDCPIGNVPPQVTPALVTWRLIAGDTVTLRYRLSSDGFAEEQKTTLALAAFPAAADTPNGFLMVSTTLKQVAKKGAVLAVETKNAPSIIKNSVTDSKYSALPTVAPSTLSVVPQAKVAPVPSKIKIETKSKVTYVGKTGKKGLSSDARAHLALV